MRSYYGIFRQSPQALRKQMARYVEYFNGCKTVLDIGCGWGEFLELLKKAGINAIGVDNDSDMIKICQDDGFETIREDIFEFLNRNVKFDGIFASHIIEYHCGDDAENLLRLCYNSANTQGKLIVVTPNPENLHVITKSFWLDLSHIRPYPLDLLNQMVIQAGFSLVVSAGDPTTTNIAALGKVRRYVINEFLAILGIKPIWRYLYSSMDIFVVGEKR